MKKSFHSLFLFAVLAAILGACGGTLSAPFCDGKNMELPPGAAGRYRLALLSKTPRYSGAYVELGEMEFTIGDEPDLVRIEISAKGPSPQWLREKLSKSLGGSAQRALAPEGVQDLSFLPLTVCRIGSTYYVQTREDNGTYSVSRFDLSPDGISSLPLVFEPSKLKEKKFNSFYLPQVKSSSGNEWVDSEEGPKLIVDNRNMSPERLDELLRLAKPTLFGRVFSRVEEAESQRTRPGRVTLRFQIPKN